MNNAKIARLLVTEKSTRAKALDQYIFKVHCDDNKVKIAANVEKIYNVKVTSVNTTKVKGKMRRVGKIIGQRKDWKKAYVTLAQGHTIDAPDDNAKE